MAPKRAPTEIDSPASVDHPPFSLRDWFSTAILKRRFIRNYFIQLDTEYEALCEAQYKSTVSSQVARLRQEYLSRPTWGGNHRYELLVIRGLPEVILQSRMQIYKLRLIALAGANHTPVIEAAFPSPDRAQPSEWRRLALGMVAEIQRLRLVRSEFERLRNRLLAMFMLMGFVIMAFAHLEWLNRLGTWLAPIATSHGLTLMAPLSHDPLSMSIIAGVVGAYLSVLLRLGSLQWCPEFSVNYHQVDRLLWNMALTFCLALFEGAVAAFVLYTVFAGKLLLGGLFPEFHALTTSASDAAVITRTLPNAGTDLAKLVFWCILAGFSERLIPDLLTNFSESARQASRVATSAPPATPGGSGSPVNAP